jgi:hypothetical protein
MSPSGVNWSVEDEPTTTPLSLISFAALLPPPRCPSDVRVPFCQRKAVV